MKETELFLGLARTIEEYRQARKNFIPNDKVLFNTKAAINVAHQLFPDATIEAKADELGMGSVFISITDYDFVIRGAEEIELFHQLIDKANNFEIHPIDNDYTKISLAFHNAFIVVRE